MPRGRKYPQELIDRGVRLVFESGRPIAQVAADLGMHPEALRKRVRQAEADAGAQIGVPTSKEREELRRLRKENYELRRANEILKAASAYSLASSTRPGRSDELHRSASRSLRGRADLPDAGVVCEQLLRAQDAATVDAPAR